MKTRLKFLFIIILVGLYSCEKNEKNPSLQEFDNIKPNGWECEIIVDDFNPSDIATNADNPTAIVKYTNVNRQFEGITGQTDLTPSLILNLYPINQRKKLVDFIKSQMVYSWCIPIYYGETKRHFIVTSPCFMNSGVFTEHAKSNIEDLYAALDKIVSKRDYGLIGDK